MKSINKCPNCIKATTDNCDSCYNKKLCLLKYDNCQKENYKRKCNTEKCDYQHSCLCYETFHKKPILSATESEKYRVNVLEDYDEGYVENYE